MLKLQNANAVESLKCYLSLFSHFAIFSKWSIKNTDPLIIILYLVTSYLNHFKIYTNTDDNQPTTIG